MEVDVISEGSGGSCCVSNCASLTLAEQANRKMTIILA